MAILEFSPQLIFNTVESLCQLPTSSTSIGSPYPAVSNPVLSSRTGAGLYTRIRIYGGTRPLTRPTDASIYLVDRLVEYRAADNDPGGSDFSYTQGPVTITSSGSNAVIQVVSLFVNATASGTATWFSLATTNNTSTAVYHWVTGTVGTDGSGADLIITNTSIVSGQPYKITNFTLTIPGVYSY